MKGSYFAIIVPVLIHLGMGTAVSILGAGSMDSTMMTALTAVLTLPAVGWMYCRDKKREMVSEAALRHGGRGLLTGGLCFAAGSVLNIGWSALLNLIRIGDYFSNQTQEQLLSSGRWMQIIGLGILVPIVEELIFRGLVYDRMKQLLGIGLSAVLSALLFAVYHGNPIQMIFSFPMAVILAVLYEQYKLLIYPILFHAGVNLTAVFLNFL